jgi:hypothetical protein
MITLKDFMEVVDYRITEGSEYCWQCYGSDAYRLDSWNQEQDGHSVSIVFDTQTQTVYEVSAYDYSRNRAYRLINPDFKFAHDDEASGRGVDVDQAWDDVNYVDLETEEDFLEKARAIVAGEDYDTRVSVPLTVTDDVLFDLMKLAHERDVTLNQLVEGVLWDAIHAEEARRSEIDPDEDGWDKLAEDHWDDEGEEEKPKKKKKRSKR